MKNTEEILIDKITALLKDTDLAYISKKYHEELLAIDIVKIIFNRSELITDEEIKIQAKQIAKYYYNPDAHYWIKTGAIIMAKWMRDTLTPKNWVKLKSISRIRLVEHYKKFHGVSGVAEENQIDIDWAEEVIKSLCTPIKEQACEICGSTDEHIFDNPSCNCNIKV